MTTFRLSALALVLVLLPPLAAAQDALRADPGYVDIAEVEAWFDEEATLEVNISGPLLELVAEASRTGNPDLAELLDKMKAIQVRGYERGGDPRAVQERMRAFAQRLERRGWETVVRVREDDEYVNMYLNVQGGAIMGLVVMVDDGVEDETIFVNIVGEIDPKQIGRIGRAFDIDPLGDLGID